MPTSLPPARRPHADPCDPAYHVYCPHCATWAAGAQAVVPQYGLAGELVVQCGRCGTSTIGRFDPEQIVLPFGAFSGRSIASLRSPQELAVLDQLLLHRRQGLVTRTPPLYLAILWQLGWLSPERQQQPPGPDVEAYRQAVVREQQQQKTQQRTQHQEQRQQDGQDEIAREQAKWAARVRAEAERQREERQRQRARIPQSPAGAEAGPWLQTLGLTPPITRQSVRQAYYQRSKELHPDLGGDVVLMQQLNQAKSAADAWLDHLIGAR